MGREKVIKGLHDARRYLEDKEWSDRGASPHIDAINDALALLEEHEAVKPREFRDTHHPAGAFACGVCGERIVEKGIDFYCPKCGLAVKWE